MSYEWPSLLSFKLMHGSNVLERKYKVEICWLLPTHFWIKEFSRSTVCKRELVLHRIRETSDIVRATYKVLSASFSHTYRFLLHHTTILRKHFFLLTNEVSVTASKLHLKHHVRKIIQKIRLWLTFWQWVKQLQQRPVGFHLHFHSTYCDYRWVQTSSKLPLIVDIVIAFLKYCDTFNSVSLVKNCQCHQVVPDCFPVVVYYSSS